MADYFILECATPVEWEDRALLRATPLPPGETSWRIGRRFQTSPVSPIPIEMMETHSDALIQLHKKDALIMPKTMLAALRESGVDNLDAYETIIRHPKTGFVTADYVACNLLGLVAVADIAGSKVVDGASDHRLDTGFEGVAIDSDRARGLLMFRLAENTGAVVVHDSVRKSLERRGFDQLVFTEPENWIG